SAVLAALMILQPCAAHAGNMVPVVHDLPAINIPAGLGTISESYRAQDDKSPHVWLIQDAHTNASGQESIAGIIEYLNTKYGIHSVYMEGGSGDVSLSYLRGFSDERTRKRVAADYLKKGRINGAEYLDLASDLNLSLWGVEEPLLYDESLEIYREIVAERQRILGYLASIRSTVNQLKSDLYSPELALYDRLHRDYQDEKIQTGDFHRQIAEYLISAGGSLDAFKELNLFNQAIRSENEIDFPAVTAEIERMLKILPEEKSAEIRSLFGRQKSGDATERNAFYEAAALLRSEIEKTDGSTGGAEKNFPNFYRYESYLNQIASGDISSLIREQSEAEQIVYELMTRSPDEKKLYETDQSLGLLEQMARMKIQPKDYPLMSKDKFSDLDRVSAAVNELVFRYDLEPKFTVFQQEDTKDFFYNVRTFYLLTMSRDRQFVLNILNHQKFSGSKDIALLAGGFHTDNLTKLLKERQISYSLIVPAIREETDHLRYENLLLNQTDIAEEISVTADQISLRAARHREIGLITDLFPDKAAASRLAAVPGIFFMDTQHDVWISDRLIPELKRLQEISESDSAQISLEYAFGENSEFMSIIRELRPDFKPVQIRGKMNENLTPERFSKLLELMPNLFEEYKIPYLISSADGELRYFHVIGYASVSNGQPGGATKILYVSETDDQLTGVTSPYYQIKDIHDYVASLQSKKSAEADRLTWYQKFSLYGASLTLPVLININLLVAYIAPAAIPAAIAASIAATVGLSFIKNAYIQKDERMFLRYGASFALVLFLFILLYAQQPISPSGDPDGKIISINTLTEEGDEDEGIQLSMSLSDSMESSSSESSAVEPVETADTQVPVAVPAADPSELFYEAPTQTNTVASSSSSSATASDAGDGFGEGLFGKGGKEKGDGTGGKGDKGTGSGKISPLSIGRTSELSVDITLDGSGSVGPEERALMKQVAQKFITTYYSVSTQNPLQFGLYSFDDEFRTHLPTNTRSGAEAITRAGWNLEKTLDDCGCGTRVEEAVRALAGNHKFKNNPKFGKISFVIWDNGGMVDPDLLKKIHNEGIADIVFIVIGSVEPLNMPPKSIFLKNPTADEVMYVIQQVLALKKQQKGGMLPFSNQILLEKIGLPESFKSSLNIKTPERFKDVQLAAEALNVGEPRIGDFVDRGLLLSTSGRPDAKYPFYLRPDAQDSPVIFLSTPLLPDDTGEIILGSRLADKISVEIKSPRVKSRALEEKRRQRIKDEQRRVRDYVNQESLSTDRIIRALDNELNRPGGVVITAHPEDFMYIEDDELILRVLETFAVRHQQLKKDGRLGKTGNTRIVFVASDAESRTEREDMLLQRLRSRLIQKSIDSEIIESVHEIDAKFAVARIIPADRPEMKYRRTDRPSIHLPFSLQSSVLNIEVPMIGA
ncbi:MAG: VWA domain-containing protein, partial [Candidatus Omnitrophica bacterium]|nr:VWA domain-containing protein [Candidatus Omnitrophota bacterium]